jgi:hypothetical protein
MYLVVEIENVQWRRSLQSSWSLRSSWSLQKKVWYVFIVNFIIHDVALSRRIACVVIGRVSGTIFNESRSKKANRCDR